MSEITRDVNDEHLTRRLKNPEVRAMLVEMSPVEAFVNGWMNGLMCPREEFNGLPVLDFARLVRRFDSKAD